MLCGFQTFKTNREYAWKTAEGHPKSRSSNGFGILTGYKKVERVKLLKLQLRIRPLTMAGILFEDIFDVKDIDPDGKKFERGTVRY